MELHSPFIFTTDSIAEMCHEEDIHRPINIRMLNEFECVLEYPSRLVVNWIGMKFSRITHWFGYSVEVNATIATPEGLQVVSWERRQSAKHRYNGEGYRNSFLSGIR